MCKANTNVCYLHPELYFHQVWCVVSPLVRPELLGEKCDHKKCLRNKTTERKKRSERMVESEPEIFCRWFEGSNECKT
jgi:hypothetical protein